MFSRAKSIQRMVIIVCCDNGGINDLGSDFDFTMTNVFSVQTVFNLKLKYKCLLKCIGVNNILNIVIYLSHINVKVDLSVQTRTTLIKLLIFNEVQIADHSKH